MNQTALLLVFIVLMVGFMFWSQWRSRKRYQERMSAMQPGDRVVTIGGIYGKLTQIDREANTARVEIADGVEIQIALNAIGQRIEAGSETPMP